MVDAASIWTAIPDDLRRRENGAERGGGWVVGGGGGSGALTIKESRHSILDNLPRLAKTTNYVLNIG